MSAGSSVRALAFYLPQYHPIPENDQWWGPGFTEWTNVVRARPAFAGHEQPHVPADLGFYDLRCRETRHDQAALARAYGIHGFCYYHYWFNGRLLLERPLLDLLDDTTLNFPFCLCWANENWTRRWDGLEQEVLMAQDYATYDPAAHIAWLARAFRDPRYVRVGDRPLFLVYRAIDLPDIAATIEAWRAAARAEGLPDLYLCAVANSQNSLAPEELLARGFDGVVEFEPNLRGVPLSRPTAETAGLHLFDYREVAARGMARETDDLPVFPGVFPSWDNTARRGWRATVVQNTDAGLYQRWLERACERVLGRPQDERLVFINAWNEWAEGCHLEPDTRHGRLFLAATARALGVTPPEPQGPALPGHTSTGTDTAHRRVLDVRLDVDRPIYIWGTGSAGQRVARALSDVDVRLTGFLDNDARRWNTTVDGLPVYPPAEVLDASRTPAPFVLVASMAQDAIAADLDRLGAVRERDYVVDAMDLTVRRIQRSDSGYVRITSRVDGARCPVCLTPGVRTREGAERVCPRCQSTETSRLAALVFCDTFDWAHAPIVDAAPRPDVRVLHDAPRADALHALQASVSYTHVTDVPDDASADVDLILVAVREDTDIEGWLAYGVAHLAHDGHVAFMCQDETPRLDIPEEASRHGLSVGAIDRDWPRYGVGRARVWLCRKD